MRQRIYVDTSVIGGYYDEEFEPTKRLFNRELPTKILMFIFLKLTKRS